MTLTTPLRRFELLPEANEGAGVPFQPPVPRIAQAFDTEFANAMAALESYNKHLHRPNTYLHKWWARRCGSTFRLILKYLAGRPTDYYAGGGLEGTVILDPMMGGGTTLHEAIRLGASVIGADIDPIPVLQARATLSLLPLSELEEAFRVLYDALARTLEAPFTTRCPHCAAATPAQFLLHGLRQTCRCGPVLSVEHLVLRHEADGTVISICPRCRAVGRGRCECEGRAVSTYPTLVEKRQRVCPTCRQPYREEPTTPFYARYEPVATVGNCARHGLFFAAVTAEDRARVHDADSLRSGLGFSPEQFAVCPAPESSDLIRRGVTSYLDLFSSGQLVYLRHAIDTLQQFAPLVRLNLGLLISTSPEFNSMLCGYKGGDRRRPGAIRHTFSHHAYSFPYTALENNPVYPSRASGNLQNLFDDRIRKARAWAQKPRERTLTSGPIKTARIDGEVDAGVEVASQGSLGTAPRRFMLINDSSASLPLASESVDHVVTDPPYFDSVQYSDLAGFFRVWLRQLLPTEARWDYDAAGSAVDPQGESSGQYVEVLGQIFAECYRVLKPRGVLVLTFHHWNPKGWSDLTLSLKRAGFHLLSRYVVHAENPMSVHISNLRALTDDAVLVLAKARMPGVFWPQPVVVDQSASAAFTMDCASVLGYLLDADLSEDTVRDTWNQVLSP